MDLGPTLSSSNRNKIALALHGGAGVTRRDRRGAAHEEILRAALETGYEILRTGGTSLDAASAAVVVLEDSPLFNAGRGSCLNAAGEVEMDASCMDGASLAAGAVAAVRRTRNPVLAARAVMEKSPHVILSGQAADNFAGNHGLALEAPAYFQTEARLAALKKGLQRHHGTVGAVALDAQGNLAAATSTGGYTGKLAGRVGDSPIIGAGTYADNRTCAVSGTGWGEAFIRVALAHEVSSRMRHLNEPLQKAARSALRQVQRIGGDGGLVAVDRRGNIAMPFNSAGMFRACIGVDGRRLVKIYR